MSLLREVKERVNASGAFRHWRHEADSHPGTLDLSNLSVPSRLIYDYAQVLTRAVAQDNHAVSTKAVFAIMQHLYPIVEALDSDAAQYLAQAVEALRR